MTKSNKEILIEQIEIIRSSSTDIGNLPQKVDDWHGNLVKFMRTGSIVGAISSAGTSVIVSEIMIDQVWENRDNINAAVRDAWSKLTELEPSLSVPVKFLEYADEWRNIKGDIDNAWNSFNATELLGEWQGDAAQRYSRLLRPRQSAAFLALSTLSENIAINLESVAAAELKLFTEIATHSQALIKDVTDLTGTYIGNITAGPLGPVSASTNLVSMVEASREAILGFVTSTATTAQSSIIAENRIKQDTSVQLGIPDNKLPSGVADSYGTGKAGIQAAIGDASTKDGDKSDWSI